MKEPRAVEIVGPKTSFARTGNPFGQNLLSGFYQFTVVTGSSVSRSSTQTPVSNTT